MPNEPVNEITAVLFDYGMVLSGPPVPEAWRRMERIFSVDEDSLKTAYWNYRDEYDRGSLNGPAYWRSVARDLNQDLDAPNLAALIEADNDLWTAPNSPMIEWAASLQRGGIKTGILSNIGDEMESGIRSRFAWLSDFTHHTFSHRLGIAKPDPAIYRHAADGLHVRPRQILFVDDKEENIAAARAAGMVAVQYTSHESFVREMRRLGLGSLLSPSTRSPASQA